MYAHPSKLVELGKPDWLQSYYVRQKWSNQQHQSDLSVASCTFTSHPFSGKCMALTAGSDLTTDSANTCERGDAQAVVNAV